MVFTPDSGLTFLYGEVSVTKNNLGHFLPGMYFEEKFHPGSQIYQVIIKTRIKILSSGITLFRRPFRH